MKDKPSKLKAQKGGVQIINAAFDLFAKKGYVATSVDSIAQKANVSKGLIYHYFNSKEEILKAVFSTLIEQSRMIEEPNLPHSPKQFLKKLIEQSFDFITRQTQSLRLMLALSAQPEVVNGLKRELE